MPGAGAEHAMRMEAQARSLDIVRQSVEIDAADLGEIARRQRAGDRLGARPTISARAPCAWRRPRVARDRGTTGPSQLSTMSSASAYSRPSTASASRHDRRRRRSRSNNSDRGRSACSVLFRRGTGTGPCGCGRALGQSTRSARSISVWISSRRAAAAAPAERVAAAAVAAGARGGNGMTIAGLGGTTIAGFGGTAIAGLIGTTVAVGAGFDRRGCRRSVLPSVCDASPQLRPNFRSTRIGTSSETASQPSCATSLGLLARASPSSPDSHASGAAG